MPEQLSEGSLACLVLDDACGQLLKPTVRIAAGGDFENRLPDGDAEKKYDYKIIERFLERVRPKTEADSEIQLKLQRQALTCGNAKLCVVLNRLHKLVFPSV